jgi:hypothetical protein
MSDYEINKNNATGKRMIMIESDAGYISPDDKRNKAFVNEMKKLEPGIHPSVNEPLIVYVVLQKYGVKNRNGRIYPESILKREVDRYQELIRERRAIGECVPAGTEIFTKNGWVDIKDVSIGDDVYTLNLDTNQIEIQRVYDTIKKHYDDDLVHIYNKGSLDMKLTKNHKMVLWDRNNNPYEMTAIEFYDAMIKGDSKLSHSKINYGEHFELMSTNIVSNITLNDVNVELEEFNDNVYCVSVPNKTWLMRYNNQVAWTHNCDHPESSIIATDRVSHNIIETWWEGKTLMGKMEILMSPGYINYGIASTKGDEVANLLRNNITIGVSSRGVGSLREVNGDHIVQDDFEIICWDIVTAPSTPGSWMFKDKSEARPFVESVEKNKNTLSEGLDKFLLD